MIRKRELENELCVLCDNKYKGAQIRSKAKWIVEGEKNTSYFLGLESKHQTSNVIKEVLRNDGECVKSDNEILGEMCLFYETLYSSNHVWTLLMAYVILEMMKKTCVIYFLPYKNVKML